MKIESSRLADANSTIIQRDRLISTLQEEKKEQALAYDRKQREVDQLRGDSFQKYDLNAPPLQYWVVQRRIIFTRKN